LSRRANVKERSGHEIRACETSDRGLLRVSPMHLCAYGESALWSSLITNNTVHENSHASAETLRLLRSTVTFADSNRARVIRTREQLSVINWKQIN